MKQNCRDTELSAYQRAGRIAYLLTAVRMALTTEEVAREVHLSRQGALHLLNALSGIIPIYQDEKFIWRLCARDN